MCTKKRKQTKIKVYNLCLNLWPYELTYVQVRDPRPWGTLRRPSRLEHLSLHTQQAPLA